MGGLSGAALSRAPVVLNGPAYGSGGFGGRLFALEVAYAAFILDAIAALNLDQDGLGLTVKALIYFLFQIAIAIFFIIAGTRLLRTLKKGRKTATRKV